MKKKDSFNIFLTFAFLAILLALAVFDVFGQQTTRLSRKCTGATPVVPMSLVDLEKDGDINILPCNGRSIFINGVASSGLLSSLNGLTTATQTFAAPTANDTASWSSVTSTHTLRLPITGISGSSRTNFFPYFDAANTLAKSPFSWNGTLFTRNNTALNSEFTEEFTPSTAAGRWRIGDFTTTPTNYIDLNQSGNSLTMDTGEVIKLFPETSSFYATINKTNGVFTVSNTAVSQYFTFDITSQAATIQTTTFINNAIDIRHLSAVVYRMNRTITAGGTTGNQTIEKPNGSVNFAAGATALTVTNGNTFTTSLIIAIAQTNDATCSVKNAVAGAGSFVINMTAACTAETRVAFWIYN